MFILVSKVNNYYQYKNVCAQKIMVKVSELRGYLRRS